jgi:hypothetical protein
LSRSLILSGGIATLANPHFLALSGLGQPGCHYPLTGLQAAAYQHFFLAAIGECDLGTLQAILVIHPPHLLAGA